MRKPRIKIEGEGYYHLVSRCCLKQLLFTKTDKDMFVKIMRRAEFFCGVEILSYCVMDNHFHILVHVPATREISEKTLLERCRVLYGEEKFAPVKKRWKELREKKMDAVVEIEQNRYRARMGDITPFMQTLKQRFATWMREAHGYEGTIWQGRFGSTLIDGSRETLSTVAAYIDLNPIRAKMVDDPKDYAWSGFASALKGNAKSMRGISRIFDPEASAPEFLKTYAGIYREKLYIDGSDSFDAEKVQEVLDSHGKLPLAILLRCKFRFFSCAGILGSKEFVDAQFEKHRTHFSSGREKGAHSVGYCENWGTQKLFTARKLRKSPISLNA